MTLVLITPRAREGGVQRYGRQGLVNRLVAGTPGSPGGSPEWSRVGSKKVEGLPQVAETWQAPKYSDRKEELHSELEWFPDQL